MSRLVTRSAARTIRGCQKKTRSAGGNIRRMRKAKRLTLEQLAEKTESNPKYLGAVERGEENIGLKKLAHRSAPDRSLRAASAGSRRRAYRGTNCGDQNRGWSHTGFHPGYRAPRSGLERESGGFSEEAADAGRKRNSPVMA